MNTQMTFRSQKYHRFFLRLLKPDAAKAKFPNKKSPFFNRQKCSLCIPWNINMQIQLLNLNFVVPQQNAISSLSIATHLQIGKTYT